MGRMPKAREQEEFGEYLRQGRDEMNLLEHSISSADTKVDLETRSILFTSEDRHPETGEVIERSWDVTFSAKFGRPTPKDDDVFVALMKVSQDAGLMNTLPSGERPAPQVRFSSYQLIRILGWPDDGRSYRAIDDALNRLGGIWIVAKNYWWDNQEKEFVDRKFGIIDDVFLYERDKYDRALKKARLEGKSRPLSWLKWSDVMLDSFQAGYVRKLNIEFYRTLEHPTARKLYRYLGKQFWSKRTRHAIDLQRLCHEKLGYSQRVTLNAQLRRKIEPAIRELEEKRAYGLSHQFDARYGKCEVIFLTDQKNKEGSQPIPKQGVPKNPLLDRLLKFGVDQQTAIDALQRLTSERIVSDIEHVEYEQRAKRVKSSPAGMLAQMLKSAEPWGRPQGFRSSVEREQAKQRIAEREQKERLVKEAREAKERQAREEELCAFHEFMASLSKAERTEFETQALQDSFWGRRYRTLKKQGAQDKAAEALQQALERLWKEMGKGPAKKFAGQGTVQKSIRF